MPVKESGSKSEMRESSHSAKQLMEMENVFWRGLKGIGIIPDHISVDGQGVRLIREGLSWRLPAGVLSSGISVLAQDGRKRDRASDWPFARQIGYLSWNGRRECKK